MKRDTNGLFMMGKVLMRLVLPHQFTETYVYGSYVFFFLVISWFPFLNMKYVVCVLLINRDVLLLLHTFIPFFQNLTVFKCFFARSLFHARALFLGESGAFPDWISRVIVKLKAENEAIIHIYPSTPLPLRRSIFCTRVSSNISWSVHKPKLKTRINST